VSVELDKLFFVREPFVYNETRHDRKLNLPMFQILSSFETFSSLDRIWIQKQITGIWVANSITSSFRSFHPHRLQLNHRHIDITTKVKFQALKICFSDKSLLTCRIQMKVHRACHLHRQPANQTEQLGQHLVGNWDSAYLVL